MFRCVWNYVKGTLRHDHEWRSHGGWFCISCWPNVSLQLSLIWWGFSKSLHPSIWPNLGAPLNFNILIKYIFLCILTKNGLPICRYGRIYMTPTLYSLGIGEPRALHPILICFIRHRELTNNRSRYHEWNIWSHCLKFHLTNKFLMVHSEGTYMPEGLPRWPQWAKEHYNQQREAWECTVQTLYTWQCFLKV